MHRETLYMCVDYVDRFLSRTSGIKKTQLQLIGITALFIAAKMEACKLKPLLVLVLMPTMYKTLVYPLVNGNI